MATHATKKAHPRRGIGGRKPIRDEGIIQKLENAFRLGYNVWQACLNAGVSRSVFYNWMRAAEKSESKKEKEFLHRIEAAQDWLTMLAKAKHAKAVQEGDGQAVRFQLKTKAVDKETGKHEYKEHNVIDTKVEIVKPDLSEQSDAAASIFLDVD